MSGADKDRSVAGINAALFSSPSDAAFMKQSLARWLNEPGCYLMTVDDRLLPMIDTGHRLAYAGSLPETPEVGSETILAELASKLSALGDVTCLIVDMSWALNAVWGATMVERWGGIAHQVAEKHGVVVVSFYDREILVEDQLAAAFRVHRTFVSPSGLYDNPHWLPQNLVANAALEEQLGFLLGRVVPEFADGAFHRTPLPDAARGATPSWVRQSRHSVALEAANARWHIHCLGQLRVFVSGYVPVDWAIHGSAPKKSRTLFAYLLNRGDNGVHADQLGEFLWPDCASEESKRARLRHAIAMLRKTLGGHDTLLRSGEYYRLNVPQGSWIDIRAFEQLCRRGLALFRHNEYAAAIRVYEAAERLYSGDLFEDLPLEYLQSEFDDWCMPKRIWLRDMAVKLQYDMSKVLRHQSRVREALEHCQKALRIDPVNDSANIETMRVLAEQGRQEAIVRQYQQYLKAVDDFDNGKPSEDVRRVYRELTPGPQSSISQTKTKSI
jgi:DNA-binding SARP family transcriptional activator